MEEQQLKKIDFSDLDKKFAKRMNQRSLKLKKVDTSELKTIFESTWQFYIKTIDFKEDNKILYKNDEFKLFNFKKFDEKIDVIQVIRSVVFIIGHLGYSPFRTYRYLFLKDDKNVSLYFDTHTFSTTNLNIFNFIFSEFICEFIKSIKLNNFYHRLNQYNIEVTQGHEYLFNKSYCLLKNEEDIKKLSGTVSQLRNLLFGYDNDDKNLISKIDISKIDQSFIKFNIH